MHLTHEQQKERARAEAEHHQKHATVDGSAPRHTYKNAYENPNYGIEQPGDPERRLNMTSEEFGRYEETNEEPKDYASRKKEHWPKK